MHSVELPCQVYFIFVAEFCPTIPVIDPPLASVDYEAFSIVG